MLARIMIPPICSYGLNVSPSIRNAKNAAAIGSSNMPSEENDGGNVAMAEVRHVCPITWLPHAMQINNKKLCHEPICIFI